MMDVMIPTGAGQIGMAIARRMGYGMKIVIGDKRMENAVQITDTMSKLLWPSIIGYLVIYPCFYVGRSIVSLQKHDGGGCGRLFPLIKVSVAGAYHPLYGLSGNGRDVCCHWPAGVSYCQAGGINFENSAFPVFSILL